MDKKQLEIENLRLIKEQEKFRAQIKMLTGTKEKITQEIKQRILCQKKKILHALIVEEKLQEITREKRELETLLSQLSKSIISPELQRIISDKIKTQSDLHATEKEKLIILSELNKAEDKLNTRLKEGFEGVSLRDEIEKLRKNLMISEEKIENDKQNLYHLEKEFRNLEIDEQAEIVKKNISENERLANECTKLRGNKYGARR